VNAADSSRHPSIVPHRSPPSLARRTAAPRTPLTIVEALARQPVEFEERRSTPL